MINCTTCGNRFEPRDSTARPGDIIGCPSCGSPLMMPNAETLAYQSGTPVAVLSPAEERPGSLSEQEILRTGSLLGPYRLEKFIGRGGMGSVYLATHTMLSRQVALKILPSKFAKDPEFVERFRREALALASLSHPNIVAVHDMGTQGEISWLAMEYVDGANLRDVLQSRKLPPEEALKIVPQLCDALEYAHSRGVIHRDIKPENILVDRAGVPKIADFGLAKMLKGEAAAPLTQTNIIMGTMEYMAPEQREKTKSVDHRADIFSMGVVLYEMLTGELPVGRFAPVSRKVTIDVRLDEVVLRALDADPDQRYQRASHLGTDVSAIVANPRAGGQLEIREIGTDNVLGRVAGRRVVVRGPFKQVKAAGTDRPELLLTGNAQLKLGADEAHVAANEAGLLSLFVPRGVELDIEGQKGTIEVEGLVGALKVSSDLGPITIKRHDGPLEVYNRAGSVEMEGIRTAKLAARSDAGELTIDDLLMNQGEGTVESVSGDISVRFDTTASVRWQAHSAEGDVKGPTGSAVMEHSASGSVGAGQARLAATSSRGDVSIAVGDVRHMLLSFGFKLPGWLSRGTVQTGLGLAVVVLVILLSGNGRAGLVVLAVSAAVVAHKARKDWEAWAGKAPPALEVPAYQPPSKGEQPPVARLSGFAIAAGAAGILGCLCFLLNIGVLIAIEAGVPDATYIALSLGLASMAGGLIALGFGTSCLGHLREHGGRLRGRGAGMLAFIAGSLAIVVPLVLILPFVTQAKRDGKELAKFQEALRESSRLGNPLGMSGWGLDEEAQKAWRGRMESLKKDGLEQVVSSSWSYAGSRDRVEIPLRFKGAGPRPGGGFGVVKLDRKGSGWRIADAQAWAGNFGEVKR